MSNEVFKDTNSGNRFIMKMENPTADHILSHGIFEWPLIQWCEQFCDKSKNFVDIGAHMGTYSIHLSKFSNQVYSFEAQRDTYYNLCGGIALNNYQNIIAYNVALGDPENHNKEMNLNQVSDDGGGSTMSEEIVEISNNNIIKTHKIKVRTLDSYNLENIGFLKLDVEGWEISVLKGAENTLKNNGYPRFIFEVWPDKWFADKKIELLNYIKEIGYQIIPISGVSNMYLAYFNT